MFKNRKGILLLGGLGTRLYPTSYFINKHFLPLYDKPVFYYSLSILMLMNIKDIIVVIPEQIKNFALENLMFLNELGINLSIVTQKKPEGIAQAFLLVEEYLEESSSVLMLGDNFFYGSNLSIFLRKILENKNSSILVQKVKNINNYGEAILIKDKLIDIIEKPKKSRAGMAVLGLYFYDKFAVKNARFLNKSKRNEYEITELNKFYLKKKKLDYFNMGRGITWLDIGTPGRMLEASNFVKIIEDRTGSKIACIEEIALNNKWIKSRELEQILSKRSINEYNNYINKILLDS